MATSCRAACPRSCDESSLEKEAAGTGPFFKELHARVPGTIRIAVRTNTNMNFTGWIQPRRTDECDARSGRGSTPNREEKARLSTEVRGSMAAKISESLGW